MRLLKIHTILVVISLLFLAGCGGIQMLGASKSDLYTADFLEKVGAIKERYRLGDATNALIQLQAIKEDTLLPTERALKRNLIGVILFSEREYDQAIGSFELALSTSRLDENLTAQIYLNLASSYYKLSFLDKAYITLEQAEFRKLEGEEVRKYHRLKYNLARELNKKEAIVPSLIWYLADKKDVSQLKSEPLYEQLASEFFALDSSDQTRMIEKFDNERLFVVGYLAYLAAERRYYRGDKDGARDLLSWLKSRYDDSSEIEGLVENFFFRVEKATKLDPSAIGIILPLSGPKKDFGTRAMLGIDSALRDGNESVEGASSPFILHIGDSEGVGSVGAFRVRELINTKFVSVIIGGLFPAEALSEYLEAKRNGVFFISLSEIYLPKEQKDHLLLEIPGSVESQIARLFSEDFLNQFGKKAAILYPQTENGEAYVNEFWRRAKDHGVEITGALGYDKAATDFRDPVRNLLGLKFARERQEEFDMLTDVYALERNKSIRRIQTLRPQVDFDWIFVPSYPQEALQIIPSFSYFDAFNVKIVGGPSWRTQSLSKESQRIPLMFIGDEVQANVKEFTQSFYKRYQSAPKLIEMRAYDSMAITRKILSAREFSSRDELESYTRGLTKLTGLTGEWNQVEGIWLKEMGALQLSRGNIKPVFNSAQAN